MSKASTKYRVYKVLLESKLSFQQRDQVLEQFDKLTSLLIEYKNLKEAEEFDPRNIEGDKGNYMRRRGKSGVFGIGKKKGGKDYIEDIENKISGAITDIDKLMAGAGIEEKEREGFKNKTLAWAFKRAKFDPSNLVSSSTSGDSSDDSKPQASAEGGATSGTVSATTNPAAVGQIVAVVTGRPVEKTTAEIEEKKPNDTALSKVLGPAVAEKIGLDPTKSTNIISALLKGGHLKFLPESKNSRVTGFLSERWMKLAGIKLISEEMVTPDSVKNKIAAGVNGSVEQYTAEAFLQDLQSLKDLKKLPQPKDLPDWIKKFKEGRKNLSNDEVKKLEDFVKQGSDDDSTSLIEKHKDVVSKIKAVVKDAEEVEIAKVVEYFEKLKSENLGGKIEISA